MGQPDATPDSSSATPRYHAEVSTLRTMPGYAAPDRAQWEKETGHTPYRLVLPDTDPAFAQAKALVDLDFSTLDAAEVVRLRGRMDDLCQRLSYEYEAVNDLHTEHDLVFYDVAEQCFYVYPTFPPKA